MKKVIRLAVLSAMSVVTVFMPLNATLADIIWDLTHPITKEIDDEMRKMRKERDDATREIDKKIDDIWRSSLSRSHCSDRNRGFFSDDFQKFIDDFHGCSSDKDKSKKQQQQQQQQQHHHHHHHHHQHVENKTYHYVEREKTKADTTPSTILKKPEQPQIVYQIVPQYQIVYQQVPQEQIIYEAPQTVEYGPHQQSSVSNWLNYCKKKYRSFNPKTGTFRDRNGLEHFCYAPIN
ncbi:BA14K family protein [Bartonella taylorii]|uniref:Lectin-like protein BA14k n=1 Tax=Bartonella taylorii 8TBB TaxID=1094560 RepID=A0A9P2S091_BARTA|nr:BA14K family protein [Bartonella taylorii]EJF94561.1 hypothetical protein ME9_00874 [Bartonella taylorii 8TBB]USP01520.1 BA14K family protein [Bartonella taylorii]